MDDSSTIPGLIIGLIIVVSLPILLSIFWILKFKGKIYHILIGAGTFTLALSIEQCILSVLKEISDKETYLIILSCLSPGIFEETARFVFFYILVNIIKNLSKRTSISYGIGHGGCESILLAGFPFLLSLIKYIKGNENNLPNIILCLLSSLERISAIAIHISLSVVVFKGVLDKKIWYYLSAIFLHDGVDTLAVLYQKQIIDIELYLFEIIIAGCAIGISILAFILYKKTNDSTNEDNTQLLNNNYTTETIVDSSASYHE